LSVWVQPAEPANLDFLCNCVLIAQGHDLDTIELNYRNLHYREPMLLARNTRRRFADVSQRSGKVFHQAWVASGMAIGDLDNDGRLDVVVTTNDGPVHILHNETPSRNHWIRRRSLGSDLNVRGLALNDTFSSVLVRLSLPVGCSFVIKYTGYGLKRRLASCR